MLAKRLDLFQSKVSIQGQHTLSHLNTTLVADPLTKQIGHRDSQHLQEARSAHIELSPLRAMMEL